MKKAYNFKEPTNRSHPIVYVPTNNTVYVSTDNKAYVPIDVTII